MSKRGLTCIENVLKDGETLFTVFDRDNRIIRQSLKVVKKEINMDNARPEEVKQVWMRRFLPNGDKVAESYKREIKSFGSDKVRVINERVIYNNGDEPIWKSSGFTLLPKSKAGECKIVSYKKLEDGTSQQVITTAHTRIEELVGSAVLPNRRSAIFYTK